MRRYHVWQVAVTVGLLLAGCSEQAPLYTGTGEPSPGGGPSEYAYATPDMIHFKDEVLPQDAPMADLASVSLTRPDGTPTTLKDLANGKSLVVVMTRGYAGSICPYCSTQTSRLIKNYPEFQARNAEVVVIYPLETDAHRPKLDEFLQRVNQINTAPDQQPPPFPLVLDVGLAAVDLLGIRKDLSKSATYILDPTGAVRFAYVGSSLADRPSVKALLTQLDQIAPTVTQN